VVTVTGGSNKRVSLAALIAVKAGRRPRLVHRVHAGRRGDKRKGFTETGYARLQDAAHQQLGGPVVLVPGTTSIRTSAGRCASWSRPGTGSRSTSCRLTPPSSTRSNRSGRC
jgi:hypothetical protein